MSNTNVLGFLAAPDRESSLRAIGLSLLKVRAIDGMTCEKLGKTLECSADTIRNASNEETLLAFDCVMRLCYFFPEQTATIRALQAPPAEVPSIDDRIARIDRELDEIRKQARA